MPLSVVKTPFEERIKCDGELASRSCTVEDVTEKAGLQGVGYGMGVAVGDYDNHGYEDLFVTAYGGNKLYHNNGYGTFYGRHCDGGRGRERLVYERCMGRPG
jgi:hypothetical protein